MESDQPARLAMGALQGAVLRARMEVCVVNNLTTDLADVVAFRNVGPNGEVGSWVDGQPAGFNLIAGWKRELAYRHAEIAQNARRLAALEQAMGECMVSGVVLDINMRADEIMRGE